MPISVAHQPGHHWPGSALNRNTTAVTAEGTQKQDLSSPLVYYFVVKMSLPSPGSFLVPTIFFVSFYGSLLPPSRNRCIYVTVMVLLIASLVVKYPTGDPLQDELVPIQVLLLSVQWIDLYVLHTPEQEYWRVSAPESEVGGRTRSDIGLGWAAKVQWVWSLKSTLRGVGWNWKVKGVPKEERMEKWYVTTVQIFYCGTTNMSKGVCPHSDL